MAKSQEKVVRIARGDAANRVVAELNGKTTLAALAEKANALVVESGGDDKPKETAWHVKKALAAAEAFGLVRLQRPTDIMVEKVKAK